MLAIWFALKSFKDEVPNRHVKILSDNTTAVSYINNMGGYKTVDCNEMAKTIWSWCIENNIWISCTHIPGRSNVQADKKSRSFNDHLEWKLNEYVFRNIVSHWGKPNIDLFASRLNFQVEKYCSWKPDPYAQHVNALLLNWGYCNLVYFFPPFSSLSSCIRKLRIDSAQGIVVATLRPTQTWFTELMELLVDTPYLIQKQKKLLYLPTKDVYHPLKNKIVLMVCCVSGNSLENKDFLSQQPTYSCLRGNLALKSNTQHSLKDGFNTVVKGKLVQFNLH